jgi:hypothetical protein
MAEMNWMRFFEDSIGAIHESLAYVLTASACREGWLQGELYLAGREYGLKVNDSLPGGKAGEKLDLVCPDPPGMFAEIKIVSADFDAKMRHYVQGDVDRVRKIQGDVAERYMILVVPESKKQTGVLAKFLRECDFSSDCSNHDKWPGFRVRIWRR